MADDAVDQVAPRQRVMAPNEVAPRQRVMATKEVATNQVTYRERVFAHA